MTLDARANALLPHIVSGLSLATANRCTDFAIDALDADRGDLALPLLQRLVEVAPRDAKAWQMLGLCARAEQQSKLALDAFTRATELAPRNVLIANGHATVAAEAGLPSVALFQRARALSPGDAELMLSHVAALVADGHPPEDGDAIIEPVLQAHPEWVRGHEALANWRWMTGASDFDRSFAAAVRARPADIPLRFAWYRMLGHAGRWDDARAVVAEGRKIAGDLIEFDAAEAHIATQMADDERAADYFARAARLDDAGTKVSWVRHCLRTGNIDQADAIATPMLQSPFAAMVWPYISLIWRLKGDARAEWLDGSPPFIRTFDLPFTADELAQLATVLRGLHTTRHHPPEQSVRGGTQTDGPLFARLEPEIRAVRAKVVEAIKSYVAALPPVDPSHPLLFAPRNHLRFAGAWSVRLSAQGFHVCHTHPMGWISSALYVALPDDLGPAPAGWLQLGMPPSDLKLGLMPYAQIEPKPGRLVLFPSSMWHGTLPFYDGERLTIAFDVAVPRGD